VLDHPASPGHYGLFGGLYITLLFTYNSPWARIAFPRYVIPVIPFMVLALLPWIPKDQRLLWAFGLLSAMLSAARRMDSRPRWSDYAKFFDVGTA
jgi:hypothetical protein